MAFVGVYSVVREVGGSDWGRVGMLTTSWPSTRVPYAGHFVSSMARALVAEGASVAVAAPEFSGDGGLLASESIELVSSPVSGQGGGLVDNKAGWLPTLRALRSAALRVGNCDVWIAHWWPTVAALPLSQRAVVALHGSDVDLLDRMPSWVARSVTKGVASRATVVGVAPHLAYRFNATLGRSEALVCPLGAEPPATMAVPDVASQWRESAKPRVLTVARDAPGKGLSRARQAASMVDEVSWLIADGQPPLSPNEVWALVAAADLLVVPSEDGPNQPREGKPYIISQAEACGTAILGGPNRSVVEALTASGQCIVNEPGSEALARAVRRCVEPPTLERSARHSLSAGERLQWPRVLKSWLGAVAR